MVRQYDANRDRDSARRIWREAGWVQDKEQHLLEMDRFVAGGRAFVAEADGEVECLVTTAPGTIRYLSDDLPLCAITSVATGRVARRQGLASQLTANAVASSAREGALVSALGVFEQGFYNQLGFGSGGYEHSLELDPSRLLVDIEPRTARRLTREDCELVHASRLSRKRSHGGINVMPPAVTCGEMVWSPNGFGLGYNEGQTGELTHHMWCTTANVEDGRYDVQWMAYRTPEQFLELMGLLRALGDQVPVVRLREPPGIQLQDLIERPFRQWQVTSEGGFQTSNYGLACWQIRIIDLQGCLERTHLPAGEARFNLSLADPIASYLQQEDGWQWIAGEYVVTLGPSSGAESGADSSLPTLSASVASFTRLWLGVRPATGLAATTDLSAPSSLLEQLDQALLSPDPRPDWDF
jgi:ribosomal protein S18 acetylase RimI-like enzyme